MGIVSINSTQIRIHGVVIIMYLCVVCLRRNVKTCARKFTGKVRGTIHLSVVTVKSLFNMISTLVNLKNYDNLFVKICTVPYSQNDEYPPQHLR